MSELSVTRRLLHSCLRSVSDPEGIARGTSLGQAQLTDQQRLSLIFQGAALLAHLEHGGFYLGNGEAASAWEDAEIDSQGRLTLSEIGVGRAADLPQSFLQHLLLKVFKAESQIAGRGSARRIARRLLELWRHSLTPISPDLAVAEILDSAEYLWSTGFSEARRALVGEHRRGDDKHPWVVGPGRARRRFFQRGTANGSCDRATLEELAASNAARDLWDGFNDAEDSDPWPFYEQGRWEHAAFLWRRKRRNKAETLAYAQCLRAAGKASQALALVQRRRDIEGMLLKATCQLDLEERQAADKTVHRLLLENLSDTELVAVAEIRIRLAAARYQYQVLRQWIAKMLNIESQPARAAGLIVAAGAAFDAGDFPAMGRYLDDVANDKETSDLAALDIATSSVSAPSLSIQWHQLEGLRRWQAGDGPGSVEHLTRALSMQRRKLHRVVAARLWNDLAVARQSTGDLEGAEHACRHSLRLFAGCEGKAKNNLGLYNLAELRVRRGLLPGVADILERAVANNRLTRNKRGLAYDFELWARYELAQGRPTAALARCAEARQSGDISHQGALDVLAARAHGWLNERERAAECLDRLDLEAVDMLDTEERPALWALAGRFEDACRQAEGTEWQELWNSLSSGLHPPSSVWVRLDNLDPYHAARLVFDLEMLMPGVVPPPRLRRALELFRRRRLVGFVEVLEQKAFSAWQAVANYLDKSADIPALEHLFHDSGYPEARLILRRGDRETTLIPGDDLELDPAPRRLQAELKEGVLILETSNRSADSILGALFALAKRDLDGGSGFTGTGSILDSKADADGSGETKTFESTAGSVGLPDSDGILGSCPLLHKALAKIDRLAKGDLPVLILGESGTGKELIAKRVHQRSMRFTGSMLTINCAALSESLIQSTLFGHVKGAFTGADQNRMGIFESARGSTVFLDEIGDLPLSTQGNLLRVLQEGEIRRVGESMARKVDVRIVAATHRDLAQMVEEGTFRQDLYFRLRVAKVELPPLRNRGQDVSLLANHFAIKERGTHLSSEAREMLHSYHWPGNIRELRSVIQVAATYADFKKILPEHIQDAGIVIKKREAPDEASGYPPTKANGNFHDLSEAYRKLLISQAMSQHGKNQSAAARQLGLTRQALSYLVRKMGLL